MFKTIKGSSRGMSSKDFDKLIDVLSKANKPQLEFIAREAKRESQKRRS